jgi:predicted esterase
VAQPVAFEWEPGQANRIVWPLAADRLPGQQFSTEDFVAAVSADIRREHKLDSRYVFALGWSSGGPPTYALALQKNREVTGSLIAMSVFDRPRLPDLEQARGQAFYLLHSPEDFISIRSVEAARETLRSYGGRVELKTYEGGHGWHGDVFGNIRRGIEWLEANHAAPIGNRLGQ